MNRKEESLQTIASFDYQWREFPEGKWLLSDPEWRENVVGYILDELQMTSTEMKGKTILDAACGQGRFTWGFLKLSCTVYGVDASPTAVKQTNRLVYRGNKTFAFQANLLDEDVLKKLFKPNAFDVIWCFGVLHHLPDPEKAVRILVQFLKPNGLFHAYVYTNKGPVIRMWRQIYQRLTFEQRGKLAKMQADIKAFLQTMPLTEEQNRWLYEYVPWAPSAHSNIDQYSPAIADEYDEETVRRWFEEVGLTFTRHTPKWAKNSKNIFANGRKDY